MKKIILLVSMFFVVSACSSKQEEIVVIDEVVQTQTGFQDLSSNKPVKSEPKKAAKKKVDQKSNKQEVVVEYKQAEKEMIKELKERFKQLNEDQDDIVIIEQEPETVKFSEPVNADSVLQALQERSNEEAESTANSSNVDDKTHVIDQQEALTLDDKVIVEEKDSLKQQQEIDYIKHVLIVIGLVIFLLGCLYVGFKKK